MVEITYKRRKNSPANRVLKLRDTAQHYTAMLYAADIKTDMEKVAAETQVFDLEQMGAVTIPAMNMYTIVDSYLKSYESLLKENLIKSGNMGRISSTIH